MPRIKNKFHDNKKNAISMVPELKWKYSNFKFNFFAIL